MFPFTEPEDTLADSSMTADSPTPQAVEKAETKPAAPEVPGIECSRRLNLYRRAHKWDPNLEDQYPEEIAGENPGNDPNARTKAIGSFAEDSHYAELSSNLLQIHPTGHLTFL